MAENKQYDDNSNQGTTSAPDTNSSQITTPRLDTSQSGGQKGGLTSESNKNTAYRRFNPLSRLSSYTYNISLYILDPKASNYFSINGRLPSIGEDSGYYIIAQSGGINSDLEPRGLTLDRDGKPGPGKPGLDFFIDDLVIKSLLLSSDGSKTATTSTEIEFKITEPQGFTLLTRLAKLTTYINDNNKGLGIDDNKYRPNLYQQNYMIGIRFYGYDETGLPIESNNIVDRKEIINPGNKYALFERFFPLKTTSVEWNLSGKSVTYQWKTLIVPYVTAFGDKRGNITENMTIEGDTVGNVLGDTENTNIKSLVEQLNARQQKLYENKTIKVKDEYAFEWVKNDVFDATAIKNSSLITTSDYSKENTAMGSSNSVQESNVRASLKAVTINTNKKQITIPPGTTIPVMIDQVIANSRYITDTLIKQNNNQIEAITIDNPTTKKLQWYSINPVTEIKGWDSIMNEWAYKITFQIMPYEIPYVRSPYINLKSNYYGPVKKYDYYFTGQNTEILRFEMSYNNSFYVPIKATSGKDDSTNNQVATDPAPKKVNNKQDGNSTQSDPGQSGIFVENVRANLYSIADQAHATITILGDPDYLMDGIGYKIPESQSFGAFYSNNLSISPYGGQIFVEISFKIAEDYTDNGLLDVDPYQTIEFYPRDVQSTLKNEGYIYKITEIVSNFSKGKFEQTLSLIYVPPGQLIGNSSVSADKTSDQSNAISTSAISDGRQAQTVGPNGGIIGGQRIIQVPDSRIAQQVGANGGIIGGERIASVNPASLTPTSNKTITASADVGTNTNRKPLYRTPVTKGTTTGTVVDDDGTNDDSLSDSSRYILG